MAVAYFSKLSLEWGRAGGRGQAGGRLMSPEGLFWKPATPMAALRVVWVEKSVFLAGV